MFYQGQWGLGSTVEEQVYCNRAALRYLYLRDDETSAVSDCDLQQRARHGEGGMNDEIGRSCSIGRTGCGVDTT